LEGEVYGCGKSAVFVHGVDTTEFVWFDFGGRGYDSSDEISMEWMVFGGGGSWLYFDSGSGVCDAVRYFIETVLIKLRDKMRP
jgi:hypothetical protein